MKTFFHIYVRKQNRLVKTVYTRSLKTKDNDKAPIESFRDEFGLIDLDKTEVDIYDSPKEEIGNDLRDKRWIKYDGKKYLLKGSVSLNETLGNYTMYGELIMEEACKIAGFNTAHYDLVKYTNKDGELTEGVISEDFLKSRDEEVRTLYDLVSDKDEGLPDVTDYYYIMDKLPKYLLKDGISREEINNLLAQFKKQLLLDIAFCAVDNHIQNYGFISKKDKTLRYAPNYDREAILMLDMDIDTLFDLYDSPELLYDMVTSQCSRILPVKDIGNYSDNEPWKAMLEILLQDEEIRDFYQNNVSKIDISVIFENIEDRGIYLDDDLKEIAEFVYNARSNEMEKEFEELIQGR